MRKEFHAKFAFIFAGNCIQSADSQMAPSRSVSSIWESQIWKLEALNFYKIVMAILINFAASPKIERAAVEQPKIISFPNLWINKIYYRYEGNGKVAEKALEKRNIRPTFGGRLTIGCGNRLSAMEIACRHAGDTKAVIR